MAFAVESEARERLAFFRHERDAREYLYSNDHHPEPVFRAVRIVPVQMQEQLWDPAFRPLAYQRPRIVKDDNR